MSIASDFLSQVTDSANMADWLVAVHKEATTCKSIFPAGTSNGERKDLAVFSDGSAIVREYHADTGLSLYEPDEALVTTILNS